MITSETVAQLLQVLQHFRANHASGVPLHKAYRQAVRSVADTYSITYQTLGDGCRRRLGLSDISEFYELLAAWVRGDESRIKHQLKENAEPSAHAEIDRFFSNRNTGARENKKTSQEGEENEAFTFRIARRDARMLKALAELEGVSPAELTARIVSSAVRERMKVVARGIIKSADGHA